MQQRSLVNDPSIALVLRRSARARRITLRISQLDGRVTLTIPPNCSEAEALEFATSKKDWIKKHLDARNPDLDVQLGVQVPLEGRLYRVILGAQKHVSVEGDALLVPGPAEHASAKLLGFLKETARQRLVAASDDYAQKLGRRYTRLTLRDTRSRWGSCSSRGAIMYSWRLVLAPPEVLTYVAAHEVAHLQEMNHSRAFWRVVDRLYGDHSAARKWLRQEGQGLHRYRF